MSYHFHFRGGVFKPNMHLTEKFMLFFVMGGEEVPFYKAVDTGLCVPTDFGATEFTTNNNIVKIFVSRQGFGVSKQFYSFYFRIGEAGKGNNKVKIVPFTPGGTPGFHNYHFEAFGKFLKNTEAAELLDKESFSYKMVTKQGMLPLEVLRKLVTIDRTWARQGLRRVVIENEQKINS